MQGSIKKYRYILWDNDGVLVNTEPWYFKATQRALEELGVALDHDQYMQIMVAGQAAWRLAQEQGISEIVLADKKVQRDQYYQAFLRAQDIEIPGVKGVLETLSSTFQMAVVTTSKRVDFELIHEKRDLLTHMQFCLVREDYVKSKPHPEPYLMALDRLNARPQEALVIEDSQRGLEAACAAGIDCAVIANEFTASHDFSAARYRLPCIEALCDLLY